MEIGVLAPLGPDPMVIEVKRMLSIKSKGALDRVHILSLD